MATILVTPRSVTKAGGHPALDALTQAGHRCVLSTPGQLPDEAELCSLLPGCAGYLAGVEPVSAQALEAASQLRVISRNGTGVDNVDLDAAQRRGIEVCRAAGANARGVAELAVAHLFALARSIPFSDAVLKQGAWERRKGVELEGKTLGLVGCGMIGRLVANMALAMGMRVRAYDVQPMPNHGFAGDFAYAPLDTVLTEADFISLHCPPSPDGRPLLDASRLDSLKPGAYIVNTARAGLIDSDALLRALGSGQAAGAAIDVFEEEPPRNAPLVRHARVIASPHIGGFTLSLIHI